MPHLHTTDIDAARAFLTEQGGWLLDLGNGHYLATDDEGTVRDLRGDAFIANCETQQRWDETVS